MSVKNPKPDRHFTYYAPAEEREREKEEDNKRKKIYTRENNTNNGTNAGEVKRSDLRHFLEQSRNHGLLRPRRLERDLEENRRRMVRRDRVRDRTDRGDRDVRYCFLSHLLSGRLLLFPKRMAFWFLSLSSSF